ncbi:MAG: hypothetical protein AB7P20_21045 [Rhizobiaceae bacterium]
MVSKHSDQEGKQLPKGGLPGPFDGFATATAVGFAMTAQALDMWFGVISGVAKASQDIFEPRDKADEEAAYSAAGKSATAKAKSATRTVVADIERTVRDVAEVTVDLLGGKTKEPAEDKPAEKAPGKTADVVTFEAKPAAPTRAKKATKAAGKEQTPVSPKIKSGVESESFESVTAGSSPVASSPAKAPVVPTIDAVIESAASGDVAPRDASFVEPTAATPEPAVAAKAPAAIMPEDFRQPKAMEKPTAPDDLKSIMGVGPKLEKVLNGLGVWTFTQVAAWTPEEIAWVDDYLGLSGRISRDGWVAQADGLVKGMRAAG